MSGDARLLEQAGPARGRRPPAPVLVTAGAALALAVAYLVAPRMGGDLSAQLAHADFARAHPLTPVDLRWFGGISPFGYSLYVPWLGAAVGIRLLGAFAAVVGSVLTTTIFVRAGVRRPMLGGVLAAACQASNLAEGRVAFGVGLAAALISVLALTAAAPGKRTGIVLGALFAGAASPVAALLLGVVAGALLLHRRVADALLLVLPAAVAVVAVSGVFGDGGAAVFNGIDAVRAAAASLVVASLAPRRFPLIRTTALIGTLMVVVAYFVASPVGGNAARLTLLFAVPVAAAVIEWRAWSTLTAVVVLVLVQTPVTFGTLADAGAPATRASYFTPLIRAINAGGQLTGRVEIPELTGHWEAAYVARDVPLTRGWLRQLDTALYGDVFYDHPPTAQSYRLFLQRSATEYVAVPDARLTFYGRREADLVNRGLPYLHQIWRDADWVLFRVDDPIPVVGLPGTVSSLAAAAITLQAPPGATVHLSLRWSRWLNLTTSDKQACIARNGDEAELRTGTGGRYVVGSALTGNHHHC